MRHEDHALIEQGFTTEHLSNDLSIFHHFFDINYYYWFFDPFFPLLQVLPEPAAAEVAFELDPTWAAFWPVAPCAPVLAQGWTAAAEPDAAPPLLDPFWALPDDAWPEVEAPLVVPLAA